MSFKVKSFWSPLPSTYLYLYIYIYIYIYTALIYLYIYKCSKKCKVVCPVLEERKDFKSFNIGKTYKIRQRVDCTSAWVIYLCTCKKCGEQYVGKSKTPFKIRHSNHKHEIKNKIGGLGHHYGQTWK